MKTEPRSEQLKALQQELETLRTKTVKLRQFHWTLYAVILLGYLLMTSLISYTVILAIMALTKYLQA